MIEERELQDFHEMLVGEVELSDEDEAFPVSQLAWDTKLAEVVLAILEESGYASEPVIAPHEDESGRNRCRVIGYAFRDDGRSLDLYTAALISGDKIAPIPSSEIARLTGRAAKFFGYAAAGDFDRFDGNQAARDAATAIHDNLEAIEDVRVLLLTNARAKEKDVDSIEIGEVPVEFSVVDIDRLFRTAGRPNLREDIEIDFEKMLGRPLPALEVLPKPAEYETYLAIFPGNLIYDLYETYGPRLLEFNVRSFLQARGNVNKGIRSTLQDEPERFLAYNNGLTATVDSIEVTLHHGQTVIKSLRGLQIVNGGQTTASIHRAKKHDKFDIDHVAIAVKLTRVAEEKLQEFVPLISKYSNTQNVIQVSDLSANHDFHTALERLSERVWCPGERQRWFYERSRGGYQVAMNRFGTTPAKRRDFKMQTPPSQKFSKTDAAKYVMAWNCRPHDVSRGGQKNFSIFMNELEGLVPDPGNPDERFFKELVAKSILFKATQKIVRKEGFPAYRANILAYLVSYFCYRLGDSIDLLQIWESQEISPELEELLRNWSHDINTCIVDTAAGRNVTEWCKKEACWEEVRSLDLFFPDILPVEANPEIDGSAFIADAVDEQMEQGIELCMSISASAWAEIATWGRESGRLKDIEWKVSRTLATYSMGGWQNRPSEKQLRHALNAIRFAADAGIIEVLAESDSENVVAFLRPS